VKRTGGRTGITFPCWIREGSDLAAFESESVAAFDSGSMAAFARIGWPLSLGISDRLASDSEYWARRPMGRIPARRG
jgi:hypothetical protein